MPSLASSGKPSAVSKGNLLAGALVFFMVAGFFFLPELISVAPDDTPAPQDNEMVVAYEVVEQQHVTGDDQQLDLPEVHVDQAVLDSEKSDTSPLSHVSLDLEPKKEVSAPTPDVTDCPSPNQLAACQSVMNEKKDVLIMPSGPGTSWEDIVVPKIRVPLDESANESLKIARALPPAYMETKYALLAYVTGVRSVTEKTFNVLHPSQTLSFLIHLDDAVTQWMQQENVPREYLLRWNDASLKEPFQTSIAVEKKEELTRNYQPSITLGHVTVQRLGQNYAPDRDKPAHVKIMGYIIGGDTKAVTYYLNNDDIRPNTVALYRPDKYNRRIFYLPTIKVKEGDIVTFRAEDLEENVYEKKYRFLPNAARFPWRDAPYIGEYRISMKSFDPRYDSLFREGKGGVVSGPSYTPQRASSTSSTRF